MAKKPMTDAQRRLVELDLRKTEIDKFYENLDEAVRDVQVEVGTDGYFQADDGTVYKVVKPAGTFVSFKDLNYVRTKREGEARGSLSKTEAEAQGFTGLAK